jgi:hypothetical protein
VKPLVELLENLAGTEKVLLCFWGFFLPHCISVAWMNVSMRFLYCSLEALLLRNPRVSITQTTQLLLLWNQPTILASFVYEGDLQY